MKQLGICAVLLWALTSVAHATVDWDEGFEYASNAAMDAVWQTSCPGQDDILFPSTDRFHSGSRSAKLIFRGHQGVTPGYKSCFKDRNLNAPTTGTLYTRFWIYMENFTVDATTTKLTLHPAYNSDAYTSMWWVMMWGSPNFSVGVQKSWSPPVLNDLTENIYGQTIPQNQWVCLETRLTYATPGQQNGIVQNWINGVQGINRTNVWMDQTGQQSVFRAVRMYTQDGVGTIYYDDYAVSRDARIGCNPGSPGGGGSPPPPPPPPPPADTSPPNAPSNLFVTELWDDLKALAATLWAWLEPVTASAETAASDAVTITWPDPNDAAIQYRFFLSHFASNGWIDLGLKPSALGSFSYGLPGLPQTAGDRYVCIDAQGVRDGHNGKWFSEVYGSAACNQMAMGPIVIAPPPAPEPIPAPPPASPAAVSMRGDTVTIQCDRTRFTRIKTTGTGTKRVITCLK